MKLFLSILFISLSTYNKAQINPTILIDNQPVKIQGSTSLPYWIGAGKVLTLGQDAVSASVLEFTINNSTMEINQAIHVTSTGTVPTGKIWKIEAIGIGVNTNANGFPNSLSNNSVPSSYSSPKVYSTPGSYYWVVPPGITSICVEAWGAGGGGGSSYTPGTSKRAGGGGGGSYAYQCFNVTPGTTLEINVGAGGVPQSSQISGGIATAGGESKITNYIIAGGGSGGTGSFSGTYICGIGGAGGTSNAAFNISGQNGNTPDCVNQNCESILLGNGGGASYGGSGGSGGCDGSPITTPTIGNFPGGGGGGGSSSSNSNIWLGKSGASGQIKIYF